MDYAIKVDRNDPKNMNLMFFFIFGNLLLKPKKWSWMIFKCVRLNGNNATLKINFSFVLIFTELKFIHKLENVKKNHLYFHEKKCHVKPHPTPPGRGGDLTYMKRHLLRLLGDNHILDRTKLVSTWRYVSVWLTGLTDDKKRDIIPRQFVGAPHSLTSFVLSQSQCITKMERSRTTTCTWRQILINSSLTFLGLPML